MPGSTNHAAMQYGL